MEVAYTFKLQCLQIQEFIGNYLKESSLPAYSTHLAQLIENYQNTTDMFEFKDMKIKNENGDNEQQDSFDKINQGKQDYPELHNVSADKSDYDVDPLDVNIVNVNQNEANYLVRSNSYTNLDAQTKQEIKWQVPAESNLTKLKIKYRCNKCKFITYHKEKFERHTRTTHDRRYFIFKDTTSSVPPKQKKEANYTCSVCGLIIKRKSNLVRHLRLHMEDKPYKCNQCDYSARRKKQFIRHLRTHSEPVVYNCLACDFSSASKQALTKHIKTHISGKLYKCSQCNYTTSAKSCLTKHLRKHRDEKPYKCEFCTFLTNHRSRLTVHTRRIHTQENKEDKCNPNLIKHMNAQWAKLKSKFNESLETL